MREFNKPALTIDKQVDLWKSRGLYIEDVERVKRYLQYISYYRLSPYTLPFQKPSVPGHIFKADTNFDNILDLYVFDRELRLLVMDPIERIEVALRASITNHMSVSYGPHWYLDNLLFKNKFDHRNFIQNIKKEIDNERQHLSRVIARIENEAGPSERKEEKKNQEQKQNFLRHYVSKYDNPELPPCWMMVELLPLGQLNLLFSYLAKNADQKKISEPFKIPAPLLVSWLRSIQTIRNICAHHSRLWNRELGTYPQLPKTHLPKWITRPLKLSDKAIDPNRRIFIVLVIIQYLMSVVNPGSGWKQRLYALMIKYPQVSKAHMGMPEKWAEDPFWGLIN